jgi:hypothetical protein
MPHEDHGKNAKPSKRKKPELGDITNLSSLRWWALNLEKTSLEVVFSNPDHFKSIRKILAKAVSEINALEHPRPDAKRATALRSSGSPPPLTMSEGEFCDLDADCGDPGLECCDGVCVPRNACNIA